MLNYDNIYVLPGKGIIEEMKTGGSFSGGLIHEGHILRDFTVACIDRYFFLSIFSGGSTFGPWRPYYLIFPYFMI